MNRRRDRINKKCKSKMAKKAFFALCHIRERPKGIFQILTYFEMQACKGHYHIMAHVTQQNRLQHLLQTWTVK